MSNDPSSSATPPANGKPVPGKNSAESAELDLWDLDDADSESAETPPRQLTALPKPKKASASTFHSKKPTERSSDSPVFPKMEQTQDEDVPFAESPRPAEPAKANDSARETEESTSPKPRSSAASGKRADDLGELDASHPSPKPETSSITQVPQDTAPEPKPKKGNKPESEVTEPASAPLTGLEKVGISALIAILALAATLTIIHFAQDVPTRPVIAEDLELPVAGNFVTINKLSTYWREPDTTGEDRDVVRRGTKLLPVVKLGLTGTPSVIRVFFRDEDSIVIGDAITRSVDGAAEARNCRHRRVRRYRHARCLPHRRKPALECPDLRSGESERTPRKIQTTARNGNFHRSTLTHQIPYIIS